MDDKVLYKYTGTWVLRLFCDKSIYRLNFRWVTQAFQDLNPQVNTHYHLERREEFAHMPRMSTSVA